MKRGTNLASITLGCLAAVWSMQAIADGGDIAWSDSTLTSSVAYESGRVYGFGPNDPFSSTEGVLRAYKARNGRVLWERRFSGAVAFEPAQVIATAEMVFVVAAIDNGNGFDWFLAALEADDGEIEWQRIVRGPGQEFANSLTLLGETLVVVGANFLTNDFGDAVFATRGFDADDGDLEWEQIDSNAGQSFGDKVVGIMRKERDDDDDDDDDDRDDDDGRGIAIAYGLTNNGTTGENQSDKLVRAYDAETGRVLWSTIVDTGRTEGGGDSFVVDKHGAYFTFGAFNPLDFDEAPTGHARGVDIDDGSLLWETDFGPLTFVDGLALGRGELVAAVDCVLAGIDPADGNPTWFTPVPFDTCPILPTIARGKVVSSGFEFEFGELAVTAVDAGDGTPNWLTEVPGALTQAFLPGFNISDSITSGRGLVFVGGTQLTAFRLR